MSKSNKLTNTIFAISIGLAPFMSVATAEPLTSPSFSLKTSVQEVNGVREIEAKDYQNGIRKSKAALAKTTVSTEKAPLLTNLCVAHIAIDDLATAKQFCDDAVNANENAIALNNRAVLHCVTGDTSSCAEDFEKAKSLNGSNRVVAKNITTFQQHYLVASNH